MVRRQSLLAISLCAAAIIAVMPHASAQEIRSITRTEATSQCIGDPRTPLCAVETLLACFTRHDMSLCRRVGVDGVSFDDRLIGRDYFVISMKLLRGGEIPEDLKDTDWYRPGYLEITLAGRYHLSSVEMSPAKGWQYYDYTVKPEGNLWHIAGRSGID